MRRAIAMIFVGVVKAITSTKEQTANCKQDSQNRQNNFEIKHDLKVLHEVTIIYLILNQKNIIGA